MALRTLINGQAYSFVDVTFSISELIAVPGFNGVPIKSISYNLNQTKTMNYENSKFPTSVSYSKVESTGSVTFTLDSAEMLRDAIFDAGVSERSIVACPATDITLKFFNKGKANTTTLYNVCFTTENMTGSEGDDTLAVTCDFICSHIGFGPKGGSSDITELVLGASKQVISFGGKDNQSPV